LAGSALVEVGPFAGAQLLVLASRSGVALGSQHRVIPVAGLAAGARLALGGAVFLRLLASAGVALVRYDFVTLDPEPIVAFGTERAWGKMGAELGFSFW
jgi:hypothetical protein